MRRWNVIALWIVLTGLLKFTPAALGSITSYHSFHPISWLYALPPGESPGWSSNSWVNYEFSQGNIWNLPIELLNTSNSKTLEYTADMGQTSQILEIGTSFGESWSVALESAFVQRNGGLFDHMIDQFHVLIRNERFNREQFPQNETKYSLVTDGEEQINQDTQSGLTHVKLKLKYWPWQWRGRKKASCPCGLAISTQFKFPMGENDAGLSSSEIDSSLLLHLGAPLFSDSGVWFTAGVTHTPSNPLLDGWPFETLHQMYEITSRFSIGKNWSFVIQMRAESPLMDKDQVAVLNANSEEEIKQVASSWNALMLWRGTESIGFNYRGQKGSSFQILLIEDFTHGSLESSGTDDSFFVNNAPDLMFLLQSHILF